MASSEPGKGTLLSGIDLFHGLGARELARLEGLARSRHYEPGEVIVQEGQSGIALFVITRGRVRVTQRHDGEDREVRTIGPGGYFGEVALFSNRPRSATITALEPLDCLALHRLDFLEELRREPEIAIRLLDTLSLRLVDAERRAAEGA